MIFLFKGTYSLFHLISTGSNLVLEFEFTIFLLILISGSFSHTSLGKFS